MKAYTDINNIMNKNLNLVEILKDCPKKDRFDPKTLKPFDKVLFRDYSINRAWTCGIFSHANFDFINPFRVGCCLYKFCIPYNEDTKHLVGSHDEAPEYYRYWED